MTTLPTVLVLISTLQGAAAPGDLAYGAISYLTSKGCHDARADSTDSIEWPFALVYSRDKPPAFGPRRCVKWYPDTWTGSEALGAGVYWAQGDHAAIEADPMKTMFDDQKTHAAFQKAYGFAPLIYGMLPATTMPRYDGKKLKKMFDLLYVKPTVAWGNNTAQQVYDRMLKEFLGRLARDAAFINGVIPKAQQAKMAKEYQAATKAKGPAFNGTDYLQQLAVKALPEDQDQEPETVRSGRTLGTLLRRTADGSWPTVVTLLKRVLADYDPELSKELAAKL